MADTLKMPSIEQLKGRQLGRVLIKMRRLTRAQVAEALGIQKKKRGPVGQILVELGYISEEDLHLALAAQVGMKQVDLSRIDVGTEALALLTPQMAHTYKVVPIEHDERTNTLTIAIASPDNFQATDDLQTLLGMNVSAQISTREDIESALNRYYPEDVLESISGLIDELSADDRFKDIEGRGTSIDLDDLREMMDSTPVIRLLNLVLFQAIKDKASDIHFEPFEDEFKMRYRIDGVLYEMVAPGKHIATALSSRIKVMANLDIAERRLPQDGRIQLTMAGNPIDLRVSVLPTMHGESVVLRVLDRSNVSLDMNKLGLREDDRKALRALISKPNGIIVNTGPTGSGKTTTLYAALNELNSPEVKILTAEDPVEYDIDGLIQCQINPDIGLTFSRCLRSFLRQDPDIILIGEVRDLETAQISVQASLTGHLVFSTLHTNDAPSAVARLLDLGLEPFLMTATLEAIVAQRLVRRICTYCKTKFTPTEELLMELDLKQADVEGKTLNYGKGCDYCNHTGYRGRIAIYEIMVMNDDLRDLIMSRSSTNLIRQAAIKHGMRPLRDSGLLAIYDGDTTIEEVVKETVFEDV